MRTDHRWIGVLAGLAGIVWAQTVVFGEGRLFKTLAELQRYYDGKIESSRRTIEEEHLAALEQYRNSAPDKEREAILSQMLQTAMYLQRNDQVLSLSEAFMKDYPESSDLWVVRMTRYDALMNTHRLDQAFDEWQKTGPSVTMQNWQSFFQAGMLIADWYVETRQVDKVKSTYEILKKYLPFVTDLTMVLDRNLKGLEWVGKAPPPITCTDLNGKEVNLDDYKGKVVLLEFWATWCGPCVAQMPHIMELYKEFHNEGFDIVGISLDRDDSTLSSFVNKQHIPWRQISDNTSCQGANARKYNVSGIPASFLIAKDGKIARYGEPTEGFEPLLKRMLASSSSSKPE